MRILKITSMWCPSCIIMNPIIEEIINEYKFSIENIDYDLDEEKRLFYNVGKILPVMIFINENNEELFRIIGEKSKKEIINKIEEIQAKWKKYYI